MAEDTTPRIEAGRSTNDGATVAPPSRRRLPEAALWRLIPDISLRSATGAATLAAAALIGAAAMFGALSIAAGADAMPALASYVVSLCRGYASAPNPEETPFLQENHAAMTRMMAAMDVAPSGNVDRDFVATMAPHHQGAIEMAQAVLRYGRNVTVRRLAQEIIVTQQQEIAVMRLAIGDPLPPSIASPTGWSRANNP